jgi:glycogen(starch) synthase
VRILYLCESYAPYIGGVETLSEALLMSLAARGHAVQVVTNQRAPTDSPGEIRDGVPIRRLPMSWALGERRLDVVSATVRELTAIKHAFQPDVAHLAWSGPSDFYHWRSGPEVPTLATLHAPLADGPTGRALRSRADRVVGITAASGEPDVIVNGYPEPAAPVAPPPDRPVVLALGRLVFDKGFDLLVSAWPLVRRRVPAAHLVIAGDGPERPRLVADGVELSGWIPPAEVWRVVDDARLVAIPSRWPEPFGLVALDAAWRARPVVAARRGGLVDIVEHERTGLLVDPESPAALAEAIATLLEDPARACAMGAAARRRARERFGLTRMIDDYERAYAQLVHPAGAVNAPSAPGRRLLADG